MQNELSYTTPEGHTVFTSKFLKNRGTCCRSTCLHCPYGYTLKKCGLQFRDPTEADRDLIEAILREAGVTDLEWQSFFPSNLKLILLKEQAVGFLLKNHIIIKHLVLKPYFQNQGLSREMVESYLFI